MEKFKFKFLSLQFSLKIGPFLLILCRKCLRRPLLVSYLAQWTLLPTMTWWTNARYMTCAVLQCTVICGLTNRAAEELCQCRYMDLVVNSKPCSCTITLVLIFSQSCKVFSFTSIFIAIVLYHSVDALLKFDQTQKQNTPLERANQN